MTPESPSPVKPAASSVVCPAERKDDMRITSGEAWRPYERGYHAVYREHEVNHCPGCGRTQWLIGRVSAECAFCSTALPLAEASMRSHNGPVVIQHKNRAIHDWAA
jgi:hypothetical protein